MSKNKNSILLLDDEELILEVTTEILVHFGFTVETAATGEELIKKYQSTYGTESTFDVVIIDLTLPEGMPGYEAFEKLREINPEIKAIVSSGQYDDPAMTNYRDYGFSASLLKPYDMDQLKSVIDHII